jgi:hypothetical protein
MKYKPLPVEITQNCGHHYHQVWRNNHAAVYEQRNAFGVHLGYEAIAIKRAEPCHVFGKDYPAREVYPSNEDWGTLAVSVTDLDRALDAAQSYSKQVSKRRRNGHQNGSTVPLRLRKKRGRGLSRHVQPCSCT